MINKIDKAIADEDYSNLTLEEEEKMISLYPNKYNRDRPIEVSGVVVYAGLINADPACNHLVKTLLSGVTCVKCSGWYCA